MIPAQPAQRIGDHDRLQRRVGGVGLERFRHQFRGRRRPALRRAPVVHDDVPGHGEQPAAGRRVLLGEHRRSPPGPEQRLLHHVLGPAPVSSGQVQDERPQRGRVLVVQGPQQLGVGCPLVCPSGLPPP